jgi:hypothetical protein
MPGISTASKTHADNRTHQNYLLMTHSQANGTNNKGGQGGTYDEEFEKDYKNYYESQVAAAANPDASDSKFLKSIDDC